jgi:phosphatidylserine decarboxylase
MYIKFVGNKKQYVIYCHSNKDLLIYHVSTTTSTASTVLEVSTNTRITVFARHTGNKSNHKWLICFNSNYFKNVNVLRTKSIEIVKLDTLDATETPLLATNYIDTMTCDDKIYIYHSKLNVMFSEYVTPSVYQALNIMYCKIKSDFVHDSLFNPLLIYFSKLMGHYYDSEQSKYQIKQFITDYNIDMSVVTADEQASWKNFNQFFSRKINLDYRPMNYILSPADSRIISFQKNKYMKSYIKNSKFNLNQLIPLLGDDQWKSLSAGSGFISRLAPQDFHHFTCSVGGVINCMMIAGDKLFSVNPVAIKSPHVNVLADNIRVILCINNRVLNVNYYMIIVGATFVGSIKFCDQKIQHIYDYLVQNNMNKYTFTKPIPVEAGQDMGYFLYGGSTVVQLFDTQIEFNDTMKKFSLYTTSTLFGPQVESYYFVRSDIGKFLLH